MSLTYPRMVGALALVWMVTLQYGLLDWPSQAVWALYTLAWLASAIALVAGRSVGVAGAVIAALASISLIGPAPHLASALVMWIWVGVILAVTEGRPGERALVVRILVSVVYAYAAVTKLNPSFLAGEQLVAIIDDRQRWQWLLSVMESDLGVVLAWGAIASEAVLAVALWWAPARRPAVVYGIVMHAVFVVLAFTGSRWDFAYLTVLNGMLVVSYYAFFQPITRAFRSAAPTASADPTAGVARPQA